MASAFASLHHPPSDRAYNWLISGALVMITILRSVAVITTPLDLVLTKPNIGCGAKHRILVTLPNRH